MMHKAKLLLTLVVLVLGLSACRSPQAWMSDNSGHGMLKTSPTAVLPQPTATAELTATPQPLPTDTPEPTPTPDLCQETQGRVDRYELIAIGYSEKLAVSIYTPPCYGENQPDGGYPYLILLHGQTYTDQQWMDIGLPETMDRLITTGVIEPFVVVMPFESPAFYDTFNYAITRDLLPWLAENLAVCDQYACRAIGGISRGGGWALYGVFLEPGIFSSLGLHSTPGFDNTPYYIRRAIQTMTDDQYPRIYMDIGAQDYWYSYAWNVKAFFDENGIIHEWHENQGKHENAYWAGYLEEYLYWYAAGWME